ncbi:unnamed protein product [Protopolystoma xenopodis]|uniref:Uncharacterized protein n=1 Tax=Protopolystoma xenopodis TaxID=117903 RepID=A0A448WXE5_9PLAT|nr:unnamed protein product [Protopolystoma xenopodis]
MQCMVSFRQLHPEHILIKGLDESFLLPCPDGRPHFPANEAFSDGSPHRRAQSTALSSLQSLPANTLVGRLPAMLNSNDLSVISVGLTIRSLLLPLEMPTPLQGFRIPSCELPLSLLDLFSPSRYSLYRELTRLARCALLHFSKESNPQSAVRSLFSWLHSYHAIFTVPCSKCNQLIGQSASLPVWRTYVGHDALHLHCQATVP